MKGWRQGTVEVRVAGSRLPVAFAERPGPRCGAARTAIVYLHGLGSSKRDFEPAAAASELASYRLVAIDLPGSGETPLPRRAAPAVAELGRIIAEALSEIAPGRVHLVGHSMGGLVGLSVASRWPERLASFVNVEGNLAPVDCRVFSRRVVELSASTPPAEIVRLLAGELAGSGRAGYATFARHFREAVQPAAFVGYCRSIVEVSGRDPLLEVFRTLPMPRLFIHGEANEDLPYLAGLRQAGVEVAAIPGSDHFPIYSHPRRFFTVVGGFVRRRDHGPTPG